MSQNAGDILENKIWFFDNENGSKPIEKIFYFLLIHYEDIFGKDKMNSEPCYIYNSVDADCPMLITNRENLIIRLAQSSTDYWAQTIFQLSHELCHYAIRQYKKDKLFTLFWFEEIVCEAFSLYVLKYACENWYRCLLSEININFYESIGKYLDNELNDTGSNIFKEYVKKGDLFAYEKIADSQRETHRNERSLFYIDICYNPKETKELCNYQEYVCEDNATIDFERWYSETNNVLVKALWDIFYN